MVRGYLFMCDAIKMLLKLVIVTVLLRKYVFNDNEHFKEIF